MGALIGKMTTLQPILALLLAVLCGFLSEVPKGTKRITLPHFWSVAAYFCLLAASVFCTFRLGKVDDHKAVIVSIIAGGVVSLCATSFEKLSTTTTLAVAVAGASLAHLVRADSFPEVGLAFAFSVSAGALFFSPSASVIAAAVVGGLIPITDYLGKNGSGAMNRSYVGIALVLALTVSAILSIGLKRILANQFGSLWPGVVAVLAAAAGYGVSRWSVGGELWIILGIAAVGSLVVHWLLPTEGPVSGFRLGIAAVIWLALGTVGYSMLRGFGMATGILEAAFILVLLGNNRALISTGPTVGLLMYRVLRDASPDVSRALDIGQHYGVTGIVVGAVIPVLYVEWLDNFETEKPVSKAVSGLLWGFILICLPVLSIVVLGSKGASGVVVGLGLSGLLVSRKQTFGALALAIAISAGAANSVAVGWIGEALDFTRQEKLHSFGWWALSMGVAAAGILAVSRRRDSTEA